LCKLLHTSTAFQREDLLKQLHAWSELGSTGRTSHRMMSSNELRQLAAGGPVELGAHTLDHPLLSVETGEEQRRQVRECSSRLLDEVGVKPQTFSYPFGGRRDYGAASLDSAREE